MLAKRYLAASLAASVCFVVLLLGPTIWSIWAQVSSGILISDLVVAPIYLIVVLIVVLPMASPWAFLAVLIAKRSSLRNYPYWIACGVLAGLFSTMLFVLLFRSSFPSIGDDGAEVSFAAEWWRLGLIGTFAGAIGGFVFRWIGASRSSDADP